MKRFVPFFAVAVVAFLLGFIFARARESNTGGPVIGPDLLVADSMPTIEATLDFVEKREVAAEDSRFVFYTRFPYRGVGPRAVYCYEQIRPDVWFLRGFFPITMRTFQDLSSKTEVSFLTNSNSVDVVGNGNVLFSIKSMASAIRKK